MLRDVFYFNQKPNVHPREKPAKNLADARAQATTEHFWIINEHCDYRGFDWDFDFEFLPDEDVWAEEHNNVWPSQHQKDSGTWLCPLEHSDIIVYRNDVGIVYRRVEPANWVFLDSVDRTKFDLSWHPDPTDPPYIYKWGCKYFPAEIKHVLEYRVENATETKYMRETVELLPTEYWIEHQKIDREQFDFSWRPDPLDPPYTYVWGNKHVDATIEPTLEYVCPESIGKKFMPEQVKVLPEWDKWTVLCDIDETRFDFSWRPPKHSSYIYVFGNQFYDAVTMPTLEYHCPGATEYKYVDSILATLLPKPELYKHFEDSYLVDYSWTPDPNSPPYIYAWGNQWNKPEDKISVQYAVEGATEIKYMQDRAIRKPCMDNWIVPENVDVSSFDFSWEPSPYAPPVIYQFGTILDDIHLGDGPKYVTPGNNDEIVYLENILVEGKLGYPKYQIKTTLEDLINLHPTEIFWAVRDNIDYGKFDFDWTPTKEQAFNINVFGSPDSELTQTYFINATFYNQGYKDKTYIDNVKLDEMDLSQMFVKPDVFFVDRSNPESQQRYDELKAKFPTIQKTRYLNTWVDTIVRCVNKSTTELCWILNSELDYTDFDFDYYPNPWQMKMVHVFGTQWSHWGTTFMVNRETFANDTKYIKVVEHLSNLNFVKNRRAKAASVLYDTIYIDHGNTVDIPNATVVKYEDSYLNTFKKMLEILPTKKEHFVWVCSSVCDYSNFDFTYICDPFTREQLHVFPSEKQKFGDTFLVNVNKLRDLITKIEKLQDYEKINFNGHMRVNRLPPPEFTTHGDTHTSNMDVQFDYPYAVLTTEDNTDVGIVEYEPMNLWASDTKNIIVTSTGASRIIVPREAKDIVKRELYDYPNIVKNSRLAKSKPLDIVFLSNGESCADENYEHLLSMTMGLDNRIVRVDGVNGRTAAYHAAANASNTPWMFTVFAKLKVSPKFDWNWQPDRLQVPKHYVFHAKNPLNNLVYGHQAMIAYNKKMTLANRGTGLDFTQDDEHEVLDIDSGIATFNSDPWTTWRTAFREALKLCTYADKVSQQRLNTWTTVANGDYAQYCLDGANDAVSYFDEVAGDYDLLKLSYDWAWLRERFDKRYG